MPSSIVQPSSPANVPMLPGRKRKRTKWPVICIHQWFEVMRVLCLLNWGLTKHDAIIDAWPRRSIADFVGSGLRISPKISSKWRCWQMIRFATSPGFWKAVFSLVTFQHWTHWTFWIPSGNLHGNTQGCYPRGNACSSGSVQRFPDRWEVGHVDGLMTYDEKFISYCLVICHWILEGLILWVRFLSVHCVQSRMVRCSIQGRRSACYENVTIWELHERKKMVGLDGQDFPGDLSGCKMWMSRYDTTGFLGWTNGHPLLKDSLYPAPLENLFQEKNVEAW